MALKLYQQYLNLVEMERKSNKKMLSEIETGTGLKVYHGVVAAANTAGLSVPYQLIRAATSKCYRKCFGSHVVWTSALCQNICKVDEARKKIAALQKIIGTCKDTACKQEIQTRIADQHERIKVLQQKIADKKARGGSTGITRDDQE